MARQKGSGRPIFVPTDDQRDWVIAVAGGGYTHEEIARLVKDPLSKRAINVKTLRKHFGAELRDGKNLANARVRHSIFEMATTGKNVHAAALWAKTQMGWKEPTQDVNLHMTYGELVELAEKKAAEERKAMASALPERPQALAPLLLRHTANDEPEVLPPENPRPPREPAPRDLEACAAVILSTE